jgi:hypothetical protein
VIHRGSLEHELRKQGHWQIKYMILVPLIALKFLKELAAGDAGTSDRRCARFSRTAHRGLEIRRN